MKSIRLRLIASCSGGSLLLISLTLALPLALASGTASPLGAQDHPMDPLSWEEHWVVREVLHEAGRIGEETRIPLLVLQRPPKEVVQSWQRGDEIPRKAFAVIDREGATFEAVVDLVRGAVIDWREIEGVQPGFTAAEYDRAEELLRQDPRWRRAMKRRGYTDLSRVGCFAVEVDSASVGRKAERRILQVECEDRHGGRNYYPRLIAGVWALVDVAAEEVVEVRDEEVVPAPEIQAEFDAAALGSPREVPGPITLAQPLGKGFEIENHRVRWQKWSFHVRVEPKAGVVLGDVRYQDGERSRTVLYEGSLSELFVPYMDPGVPWAGDAYFDAGDVVRLAQPLDPTVDCPGNAVYLDAVIADDHGRPQMVPRAVCLFERYAGDTAWRKRIQDTVEARPRRDLVVRWTAVSGNYDYIFDWSFRQDGSLGIAVGSTGVLNTKAVAAGSPDTTVGTAPADAYGRLVDDRIVAVNHDHFFSFRLDLDVDGPANSLLVQRLAAKMQPDSSRRRSVWVPESRIASTENDAKLRIDLERPALWRIASSAPREDGRYPASYQLAPGTNVLPLVPVDEPPHARAGFVDYHLWVTPYRPDELWAAGHYTTLSAPGEGLPKWTQADRPIADTDIVIWYTLGMHHVPRVEDWPVMPVVWRSFELRPFDFFEANPALDLPEHP